MTIDDIKDFYLSQVLKNDQADRRVDLILSEIRSLEQRRQGGSAVFVPFQTALITIIAVLAEVVQIDSIIARISVAALPIIGCFSAIVWISHSKEHTKLLSWWYSRLRDAECSSCNESGGDFCAEYRDFFSKNQSYYFKFVLSFGGGAILLNLSLALALIFS